MSEKSETIENILSKNDKSNVLREIHKHMMQQLRKCLERKYEFKQLHSHWLLISKHPILEHYGIMCYLFVLHKKGGVYFHLRYLCW